MDTDAVGLSERMEMRGRYLTTQKRLLKFGEVEQPSTEPHIGTNDGGVDVRARRNELIDRTKAVVRRNSSSIRFGQRDREDSVESGACRFEHYDPAGESVARQAGHMSCRNLSESSDEANDLGF